MRLFLLATSALISGCGGKLAADDDRDAAPAEVIVPPAQPTAAPQPKPTSTTPPQPTSTAPPLPTANPSSGALVCQTGRPCAGKCVDVLTDTEHCGFCVHPCALRQR